MTAGRLDNDAYPDLVVTTDGNNNVGTFHVLLNDGDGVNFTAQTPLDLGYNVRMAALGDLDGDGKLDATVVARDNGTNQGFVRVLLGDGAGAFSTPVTADVGGNPFALAVGELPGVGGNGTKPEIVVADDTVYFSGTPQVGNSRIQVFHYDASDPNGPIVSVATVDTPGRSFGSVSVAIEPITGRFIVTANRGSDDVTVFLVRDDQIDAGVSYPVGGAPVSVTIADLNSDGNSDIVCANQDSDTMSILINNGDDTFDAQRIIGAGDFPTFVIAADLDANSTADLIDVGNGKEHNTGTSSFDSLPFVRVTYGRCACNN